MTIRMDKTTIIVCAVVGSLGVLSAILGFSAEGTKLTPYTILVYGDDCIYPQNPALGLGICAVIFLVVAQVTISAVGGCCGCCKSRSIPSETKRIVGIVCAVFSWIAAVIAWALLIVGASWNTNVVREGAPFCPYLKDGIFAGGGVLALAATALGLASFIMLRRQPAAAVATPAASVGGGGTPNKTGEQSPPNEVVMGHPLLPPPTSKVQHPSKPQAYVQAEANQQNQQAPPPAQDNGSQAANQQIPPQGLAGDAALAAAAACATHEPGKLPPRPPQVPVPNGTLQCPPIPFTAAPQACAETIPVTPPALGTSQGNGLSTVVRNGVVSATIRLAGKAVEHAVFANNSATGDEVGATDDGVAVVCN